MGENMMGKSSFDIANRISFNSNNMSYLILVVTDLTARSLQHMTYQTSMVSWVDLKQV